MNIKVPYLEKCCRRFPLKFGAKLVGWYSLFTSVLGVLIGFIDIADITNYNRYPKVAKDLTRIKIGFCLFDATFSVILLMGLYLKRPNYLFYWLIAKALLLFCEVPLYIMISNFDAIAPELIPFLLFMGLDVYGVLIIHGYYMEITNTATTEGEV